MGCGILERDNFLLVVRRFSASLSRRSFLMKIVHFPHPALRFPSKPLTAIDKQVHLQAGQMLEVMYANSGLGLAANRVAWPFQLLVMNATADPNEKDSELVLINPVIVDKKGSVEGEEGCLSFPKLFQKVRRA